MEQICNTVMVTSYEYAELKNELAASQAREKVLRDAVKNLVNQKGRHNTELAYKKLVDVLAQPTDDSALKAALAAERERVAKHFEDRAYLGSGHQLAVEIRALGD